MNENLQLFASLPVNVRPRTDNEEVLRQQITLVAKDGAKVLTTSDLPGLISSLTEAGIVVDKDNITLVAKQTKVQGNNGKPIAVFNDDGSLNANLINAKQIVADGLKANTFDAGNATINNLIVNNAQVTGKITATSGSIGGFNISTSSIGTSLDNLAPYENKKAQLYMTDDFTQHKQLNGKDDGTLYSRFNSVIGSDVDSTYSPHSLLRLEAEMEKVDSLKYAASIIVKNYNDTSYNSLTERVGLRLDVTGAGTNHAIKIENGDVAGLRLNVRKVTSSYTITKYDNIVVNYATNDNTILSLPDASDCKGQIIFIINKNDNGCTIKGTIWKRGSSTSETLGRYGKGALISDGIHWIWFWFSW